MLKDLLLKNRSYRRYDNSVKISVKELEKLVDLTRLCPSYAAAELHYSVNTESNNQKVFDCLTWAAYLKDWSGPKKEERIS